MADQSDIAKLLLSLKDWQSWIIVILVAAGGGILGGISHKLISGAEDKTSFGTCILVGAVASIAVLFIIMPTDAVKLVALSIAAGYGGKAILDTVTDKLKAATTKVEAAKNLADEALNKAKILPELNKVFQATRQPSNPTLQAIKASLPADVQSFIDKSPEEVSSELNVLSGKLTMI
ncbi:MAG: hypothetical protein ABSB95_15105 [Dissulfurispiraceae bacterium]|jgi:hypothetical protein